MSCKHEHSLCNPDEYFSSGRLILQNPRILNVKNGQLDQVEAVVIEDGKIAHIGNSIDTPGRKIDVTGYFLLPGLWDMHVHILHSASYGFPALIAHGVTGIRDMGSDLTNTVQWKLMPGVKPRIVYSGPIIDANIPYPIARLVADTPEEAELHYKTLKKYGAGIIKVHNKTPRDVFFALARWCERDGLSLCGHVPFAVHALEAISTGQVSIEHMQGIHVAISEDRDEIMTAMETLPMGGIQSLMLNNKAFQSFSETRFQEFSDAAGKKRTFVTPNLVAINSLPGKNVDLDSTPFRNYPESVKTSIRTHIRKINTDERMKPLAELVNTVFESNKKLASLLHREGIPFLAGTDSMFCDGIVETIVPFGAGLHDELALLIEAGLTPLEAIQAATINPVQSLGIENSFGTVETGKAADLILVKRNPTEDIEVLRHPEAVLLGGRFHSVDDLKTMVKERKS